MDMAEEYFVKSVPPKYQCYLLDGKDVFLPPYPPKNPRLACAMMKMVLEDSLDLVTFDGDFDDFAEINF